MRRMDEAIKSLPPGSFAMVMATGIVSIAFDGLGYGHIAWVLFLLNIATYLVLTPLFGVRLAFYFDAFLEDLTHPHRCWGFLTFVVGTNTIGSQFLLFRESAVAALFGDPVLVAQGLWVLGLVSWVALIYAIFGYLLSRFDGPIEQVVSGATLLTIVSTQSVAVLGSQLAGTFGWFSEVMMLFSLTHFAAGWVLYLIVITLVTHRLLVRPLRPEDWSGPYWICMGAVAITTLAGSNMLLYLDMGDLYGPTLVVTYLAWAIGAWWIPIQLYLDVWKFTRLDLSGNRPWWITVFPWMRLGFGNERSHFYEPPSWGRVFPMGMFTACTIALTEASDFDILFLIPSVWGWFALLVWALTFIGTLRSVAGVLARG